ncbi:uncharacterized protein Dwil_GK28307 [Drosophila willistoni]|uniref:Uncharacterized protein n=1 Tax=Drosophila willistoni TaxID=7260 RepID=A0A0Q9WNZ2_DROWI|nr:uncharacterized protein Dwil_GK28307 [Drosophila willistoni]
MTINIALYKRANGYKPFLFNFTFDFCDFKRHPKRYPYFYIVEQAFIKYSNVNHTCPYKHNIRIQNWVLTDKMFEKMPLPTGNYRFSLSYGTDGIWRATTDFFLELVEALI